MKKILCAFVVALVSSVMQADVQMITRVQIGDFDRAVSCDLEGDNAHRVAFPITANVTVEVFLGVPSELGCDVRMAAVTAAGTVISTMEMAVAWGQEAILEVTNGDQKFFSFSVTPHKK